MAFPAGRKLIVKEKPWEYLQDCSELSLKNFQLLRTTVAANALKEIIRLAAEYADATADSEMCELLLNEADNLARIADHRQKVFKWEEARDITEEIPVKRGRPPARYRSKDVA
jgi:hypothetical protein